MKRYLSDIIDEQTISKWGVGTDVVIDTPTGSGKTTFVFNRLLPYAAERGMYLVYICNRRVISKQVSEEVYALNEEDIAALKTVPEKYRKYLRILTYQHFEAKQRFWKSFTDKAVAQMNHKERKLGYADYDDIDEIGNHIMFIVFDEAHYFLSDAQFNSKINFWLKAFQSMPQASRRIFFTATPEPLYYFLYAVGEPDLGENLVEQFKTEREISWSAEFLDKNLPADTVLSMVPDIALTGDERWLWALQKIASRYSTAFSTGSWSDAHTYAILLIKAYQQYKVINPNKDPFFALTQYMGEQIDQFKKWKKITYIKSELIFNEYSKINDYYFSDYSELLSLIKESPQKDKWLIFVDNKTDGSSLSEELNCAGYSAVFLSANSLKNRRAANEYQSIVNKQKFESNILIATEVLDCGASIHDLDVKNIVVSHSRKTVFLQMIGRLRLDNADKVNLFIKSRPPKETHVMINGLQRNITDLVDLSLLNVQKCQYTVDSQRQTQTTYVPYWNEEERAKVFQKLLSNRALSKLVNVKYEKIWKKNANRDQYPSFLGMEISAVGLLSMLYDLMQYRTAIKLYEDGCKDRAFSIKHQLGWLGKEYSIERWVGYKESVDALCDYCKQYEGAWVPSADMRRKLVDRFCLCSFLPEAIYADKAKYERDDRLPGLKKLNAALRERKIGYHIESKQLRVDRKRSTFWRIVSD